MVTIQEFFYQPTPAEIRARGQPYKGSISKRDLVRIIEGLRPNEYLEIPPNMLLTPDPDHTSNYWKKHGKFVRLRVYRTNNAAEEDKFAPWQQRKEAIENLSEVLKDSPEGFIYPVGMALSGLGQVMNLRVIRLVNGIDGTRYDHWSVHHAPEDQKIKLWPYEPESRVAEEGAGYWIELPSRTDGKRLPKFTIQHVPVVDNDRKWSLIYTVRSSHGCEDSANMAFFFRDPKTGIKDVVPLDDHYAAGRIQVIAYEQKKTDKEHEPHYARMRARRQKVERIACVPMQMNELALPTQEQLDYDHKILTQVIIWRTSRDEGRVRNFSDTPHELEREVLHWNRAVLRGERRSFFPTKRLRSLNVAYFQR